MSDGGQLGNVVQVVSGYSAQTALRADGTVWAWGGGPVGDATPADRAGAVQVRYVDGTPITNAVAITSSRGAAYAVLDGGAVYAWGSNLNGMLGDNSTVATRTFAVPVFGLSNIVGISAGETHVIALDSFGNVWGWGNNASSELGTPAAGTSTNHPVQIPGLSGVASVASGRDFAFALKANGELWGWGADPRALGITDAGVRVQVPQPIFVP